MRAPSNTPPGQRSSVVGRSRRAFRMPGPTETKYSTTSIFRIPRSPKYGFSGLETRTSWPSMSRTTASLLLAMGDSYLTAWSGRAGQPVHRRGEVDQVVVHRGGDARGLRVRRVPLALPHQEDAVVEVLGHVLRARQRGHRVAGVADDEDRLAGLGVPLGQRRAVGLPHRAGVEPDRGAGAEQRVLLSPVDGEAADLALAVLDVGVGAVDREVGVEEVRVRAVVQPPGVAVGEAEQALRVALLRSRQTLGELRPGRGVVEGGLHRGHHDADGL